MSYEKIYHCHHSENVSEAFSTSCLGVIYILQFQSKGNDDNLIFILKSDFYASFLSSAFCKTESTISTLLLLLLWSFLSIFPQTFLACIFSIHFWFYRCQLAVLPVKVLLTFRRLLSQIHLPPSLLLGFRLKN